MTEDVRPVLMDYLSKHYAGLKRQLARALGNPELAEDALHDTWLRVRESGRSEEDTIHRPGGYLVRMAVNIAVDIQRRQSRSLPFDEIQALMELSDPAPGPARTAEARSELEAVAKVMERMPARQREVMVLIHWEGLTQPETAKRLGISPRTVAYELKNAHRYLNARMADDEK